MAASRSRPKPRYRVTGGPTGDVGLNYPPHRRAEPGDIVDDIPADVIGAWVSEGLIELVEG